MLKAGGRNRDQRWKNDDKEGRGDKSDRRDIMKRDKDRKQSDLQDFKERESEQLGEIEKEGDRGEKRTGSVSSSQHSTNETDGEPITSSAGNDGSVPMITQRQDTEASSEADIGRDVNT